MCQTVPDTPEKERGLCTSTNFAYTAPMPTGPTDNDNTYPSLPTSAQAFLVSEALTTTESAAWIVNEPRDLRHIHNALRAFATQHTEAPTLRTLPTPHEDGTILDQEDRADLLQAILPTLYEHPGLLLLTTEDLNRPVPSVSFLERESVLFEVGAILPLAHAEEQLAQAGYEKAKSIEDNGTFARRGEQLTVLDPLHGAHVIEWEFDRIGKIASLAEGTPAKQLSITPISNWGKDTMALGQLLSVSPISFLALDDIEQLAAMTDGRAEQWVKQLQTTATTTFLFPAFGNEAHTQAVRLAPQSQLREHLLQSTQLKTQIWTHHVEQAQRLFPEHEVLQLPTTTPPFPGFRSEAWNLQVITDFDLPELAGPTQQFKPRAKLDTAFIQSLSPGDFVVHIDHGVAQFTGTETNIIDEGEREFLVLEYAKQDRLLVPVLYSDKVSKYLGSGVPTVHRLHGASWHHVKERVKEDAERLAQELLSAAASREAHRGTALPQDSEAVQALIAAFPYEETPDQAKAWEEIRNELEGLPDPEHKQPMDRLLAGDVGFGKTELAIRAAFKVVDVDKQVMVLAPTTILAQQHFDRFSERLTNTGTELGLLTRFESAKEQRETTKRFRDGKIDLLIGTHRLLSKDIQPKNLGLIVIDEEQKFGVKQKEHLKRFRADTDILSLSATPIPRTLHAAIGGLRTMSTITTPPKGRKEVETTISAYSDDLVDKAIHTEIEREGQVFYLHNRVATIDAQAKRLRTRYPDLTIEVAHGQMSEGQLQKVMEAFDRGDIQVLVCTTIVENGIDLPNVNTLIVHDATRLGLSQLYQLRGRIGRGERGAHALFLYHREELTGVAKDRLQALQEAQRLGSGLELALRDMEIRGAGNLLGKEQSGRINAIGIALYARLLQQSV